MPITGQPRDKEVVLDYRFVTGLEKVKDPSRVVATTPEGGVSPVYGLLTAQNVDVSETGWLSRRPGQKALISGSPHSIAAWEDICLYAEGVNLKRLLEDFSTTITLFSGLSSGNPVSYCKIGNEIYFSDGVTIGKVVNGTYSALPSITFGVSKTITVNHLLTTRMTTPAGQFLERYKTRMMVASGDNLWLTDPGSFHRVHKKSGFIQMQGHISMLKAVQDGFFIADALGIYFVQGDYFKVFKWNHKESYKAIAYAVSSLIAHSRIGGEIPPGKYFFFLTEHGVCIGGDGGYFKNLTERKYPAISAKQGCALFRTTIKQVFGQQRSIDQVIFATED
jgi:hypothetical protein